MLYFGIIGYPIGHSASPAMHNSVFESLGIEAIYLKFEVKPEDLKEAIFGARALGFRGFNVTIPYKEAVLKYIKPVGIAKRIGAVNTIVFPELEGYNTDAIGAIRALESAGVDVEGKVALVVGAGGAGRAIAFALAERGCVVVVTNRTESRGLKLAEDVRKVGKCVFHPYNRLEELKGNVDIIVNATPLGMKGFESKLPIPEVLVEKNVVVFDTVYNPPETPLIRLALERGCKVVYGVDMLVHQGAEALKIWLGIDPPLDVMKNAVLSALRSQ